MKKNTLYFLLTIGSVLTCLNLVIGHIILTQRLYQYTGFFQILNFIQVISCIIVGAIICYYFAKKKNIFGAIIAFLHLLVYLVYLMKLINISPLVNQVIYNEVFGYSSKIIAFMLFIALFLDTNKKLFNFGLLLLPIIPTLSFIQLNLSGIPLPMALLKSVPFIEVIIFSIHFIYYRRNSDFL